MRSLALWIGFFVLVGVGAVIALPFLMDTTEDARVGECFDIPTVTVTVADIQHRPCTAPHTGEVFYVGDIQAAETVPYPDDEALGPMVDSLCSPAFDAYTGLSAATDPVWTYSAGVPVEADWAKGERGLMCYAHRLDEAPTTTSIKKP